MIQYFGHFLTTITTIIFRLVKIIFKSKCKTCKLCGISEIEINEEL